MQLVPSTYYQLASSTYCNHARVSNEVLVTHFAGSAAQLSSIASASGQEKENLAEGASAMVTAALRLQPLLARAQKLRAKDAAVSLDSASNINGEASNIKLNFAS